MVLALKQGILVCFPTVLGDFLPRESLIFKLLKTQLLFRNKGHWNSLILIQLIWHTSCVLGIYIPDIYKKLPGERKSGPYSVD